MLIHKNIIKLTPNNYLNNSIKPLNSKDGYFVLYYAEWCGHCQATKPSWKNLASKIGKTFNVCTFDCEKYKDKANSLGIQGFPTIKIYDKNGKLISNYSGERDTANYTNALCNVMKKYC